MASMARAEGPKGFSLESSLMSCDRRSSAAAVGLGAFVVPMSRAGLETKSKKRLMLAASCHGMLRSRHWFVAGGTQTVNFLQGQGTELPGWNVERERAIADALDFFHVVSDLFKHAPDLPVAALDQSNFVPGIVRFFNQTNACRRGPHPPPIVGSYGNTAAQLLQRFVARNSSNFHHVGL